MKSFQGIFSWLLLSWANRSIHMFVIPILFKLMIGEGILGSVSPQLQKDTYPPPTPSRNRRFEQRIHQRAEYKGISINDASLNGRLEMTDIFKALTRFR